MGYGAIVQSGVYSQVMIGIGCVLHCFIQYYYFHCIGAILSLLSLALHCFSVTHNYKSHRSVAEDCFLPCLWGRDGARDGTTEQGPDEHDLQHHH